MKLERVTFALGGLVLTVACGGRAIIDVNDEPNAGASGVNLDAGSAPISAAGGAGTTMQGSVSCVSQRSAFGASATLIDHQFEEMCGKDSDCSTAAVQTHCLNTCVATAGDILVYSSALATVSEQCLACPAPAAGDPCRDTRPACDRGRCVALPFQ